MTQQSVDSYPLGRSQAETERLMWSARLLRISIQRFLEDAGLEPGMKVLDVGCGAGDVARIAAELVGASGAVVGVDLNDTILETARARLADSPDTNITFESCRVPDDLDRLDRDFDAIVGRRVICYIPDASSALQALLTHARSGALVAFQEIDWTVWGQHSFPVSPYYERVWDWMRRAFEAGGTDMAMGTGLYETFLRAGLPEPTMRAEAGVGPATDVLPFTMNLLRSTRETIVREGIAPETDVELEAVERVLKNEMAAQRYVAVGGFEVKAWARKP